MSIPKNDDLRFEVSTLCSFKCPVCPHSKMKRAKEVMSTSLFVELLEKVLSATNQYKHVTFSGIGEPLFDPHLVDKVKYANERGLATTIVTNGKALTPEVYENLNAAGAGTVRVSILGMKDYGKAHGTDAGQLTILMANLSKISRSGGSTRLAINCVAQDEDEAQSMKLMLIGLKLNQLEIWKPHNWGDGFKFRNVNKTSRVRNCGRLHNGPLQILVDGRVVLCCFDYNGSTSLGNLKDDSLLDIFNGEKYDEFAKRFEFSRWKGTGYPCKTCDQRNSYKGGVLFYTTRRETDRIKRTSTSFSMVQPQEKQRDRPNCLKCSKPFNPLGKFNRVCPACTVMNRGFGRFAGGVTVTKVQRGGVDNG